MYAAPVMGCHEVKIIISFISNVYLRKIIFHLSVSIIWYGIGRFFIEGLRTDSLLTPIFDLRISQLVAAVSVLAGIVLLIVFRNRTVLTGCGNKKIMELNGIHDEVEVKFDESAPSTIFGDLEVELDEEDALEDGEKEAEEETEMEIEDVEEVEEGDEKETEEEEENENG